MLVHALMTGDGAACLMCSMVRTSPLMPYNLAKHCCRDDNVAVVKSICLCGAPPAHVASLAVCMSESGTTVGR